FMESPLILLPGSLAAAPALAGLGIQMLVELFARDVDFHTVPGNVDFRNPQERLEDDLTVVLVQQVEMIVAAGESYATPAIGPFRRPNYGHRLSLFCAHVWITLM